MANLTLNLDVAWARHVILTRYITFRISSLCERPLARGLATALGLVLMTTAAMAQAPDRPSWWGQRNSVQRQNPEASDREAARLYAAARADVDAARNAQAQRTLELLVANHPSSPLADVARRDLQRLYASMGQPSPTVAPAVAPGIMPARTQPLAAVALQPPSPDLAPVFPRTTVAAPIFSVRQATEDFRQQAGDRVFFADGAADIGGRARAALDAQATWLRRYPAIRITVEGHADDQGGIELNRTMAEQRAQVVKLRLNDLGVEADRITVVAYGADEPVAKCREQTCSAQNRRVITLVTHVPQGIGFDPPQPSGQPVSRAVTGQTPAQSASQSSAAIDQTLPQPRR
jgi:outer membrane protein OmpA-like peptidoglycan-associated protein